MPWRYILMVSTLPVIRTAIASDSVPPGSGYFFFVASVSLMATLWLAQDAAPQGLLLTLAGLLLVGQDRGGVMYVQKEMMGQALQLLSEQGTFASWIFYGPEGIQHPLRCGSGPVLKSSHLPPSSSSSQLNHWRNSLGMEDGGKQPHSHTRSSVNAQYRSVDTISSFSIVSVGGRSGLHHFPRVTSQKHYSATEWLRFVTEKAWQTDSFHLIFSGQWGKEHIFSSKSIQQICTAVS